MKIERTYNKRAIWWKVTYKNKAWVEVEWARGSSTIWILSYGPRGGERGGATLPLEMLDELVTVARNRLDLDLETMSSAELFNLPNRKFGEDEANGEGDTR